MSLKSFFFFLILEKESCPSLICCVYTDTQNKVPGRQVLHTDPVSNLDKLEGYLH